MANIEAKHYQLVVGNTDHSLAELDSKLGKLPIDETSIVRGYSDNHRKIYIYEGTALLGNLTFCNTFELGTVRFEKIHNTIKPPKNFVLLENRNPQFELLPLVREP